MSELLAYSLLMIISVCISSVSQIMLKLSAKKKYMSPIQEYLNPLVISAYTLFFGCTFLTMYALKVIPLSMGAILEASGYIFVALLSRIFLYEKIWKAKAFGTYSYPDRNTDLRTLKYHKAREVFHYTSYNLEEI